MKVFLIILAVLVLLTVIILSLSAEVTIIFDNGWKTKIKVLFIEKDIKLTQLLSFIVQPEKVGEEAAEQVKEKKQQQKDKKKKGEVEEQPAETTVEQTDEAFNNAAEAVGQDATPLVAEQAEAQTPKEDKKQPKPNYIKKLLDEDGVVGILLLLSNVVQTLNKAVISFMKGLHIYSFYVKMIIGGGDPADIGEKYGAICGWYYPLKGFILNQMKVDNYDDYIQADFIAPRSEYEFQLIGSLSVGLLVKVLLKAGWVFIVNYIKNK